VTESITLKLYLSGIYPASGKAVTCIQKAHDLNTGQGLAILVFLIFSR